MKADAGGWCRAAPGIQVRVLRTCQATGHFVALYKVEAGTTAAPHVHYGSAESYLISGKMEVRGGAENTEVRPAEVAPTLLEKIAASSNRLVTKR